MLDNDLIRLNQKLETTLELRGDKIAQEREENIRHINRRRKPVTKDKPIDMS
jgi:predicted phosphoribosyltransferase